MHVVLGGTSGLGWEMTQMWRQQGQLVAVIGNDYNSTRHGEGFGMDLYDRESVEWSVAELERRLRGQVLEYFVWSAGFGYRGDFGSQTTAYAMAEVNFAGAMPLVQKSWQIMLDQSSNSRLVVISSTSGYKARSDEAVYVATKHAQVGFARALGLEAERLATTARVSLFMPGGMKTAFWDGHRPKEYDKYNDPRKVASSLLVQLENDDSYFSELALPRGTLV